MFQGTLPRLMSEYNLFMNQKIYAACEKLSDEERKRDRGAFFKSIHSTLNHLVVGDGIWLNRLVGENYPLMRMGIDLYTEFQALREARTKLDERILRLGREATPEWLAEPMTWKSVAYNFTQTQPRWVIVMHFFNHQTHHRGQVHTLLMQAGIDIGVTDLPLLPILQEPA